MKARQKSDLATAWKVKRKSHTALHLHLKHMQHKILE